MAWRLTRSCEARFLRLCASGIADVNASATTRLFDNELTLPFAAFMSLWGTAAETERR